MSIVLLSGTPLMIRKDTELVIIRDVLAGNTAEDTASTSLKESSKKSIAKHQYRKCS